MPPTPLRTLLPSARSHLSHVHLRTLTTTASTSANPLPHPTVSGPAPRAPTPAVSFPSEQISRKRQQASLLAAAQSSKPNPAKPSSVLSKRFWRDVDIRETDAGFEIWLDKRPVRTATKDVLVVPTRKKHLATAIALEWDCLVSAHQALKTHYIPLTSLTSRALDVARAEREDGPACAVRAEIVEMLLGYLRTDTLLCWAPTQTSYQDFSGTSAVGASEKRLRDVQEETARPITEWLASYVWPGVELRPALEDGSILPRAQPEMTVQIVKGWLSGLPAWELAAMERAVLASKSLCVATRLIVEWSARFADVRRSVGGGKGSQSPLLKGDGSSLLSQDLAGKKFDVYEAHKACTLEVSYQTSNWGEVEDTHDVDREDVRRQLGSAVLLVQ